MPSVYWIFADASQAQQQHNSQVMRDLADHPYPNRLALGFALTELSWLLLRSARPKEECVCCAIGPVSVIGCAANVICNHRPGEDGPDLCR